MKYYNAQIKWILTLLIVAVTSISSVQAGDNDKAGKSKELQVAEEFNFTSYRKVRLDISAMDNQNKPIGNALVRVFVIDSDITELEDEGLQKKSLLTMARTDEAGWVEHEVEVPQNFKKLLLEIQNVEVEHKQIVILDEQDTIQVSFKREYAADAW